MSSGSAKEFEEFAQDCVRLAEQADTPELREKLLNLAREWMRAVMTTSPGPSPAVPRGAWGTMMAGGAPTTEKRRARVHAGDVFTHDHGDRGSGASAGGSDLRYAAVVAPKARANRRFGKLPRASFIGRVPERKSGKKQARRRRMRIPPAGPCACDRSTWNLATPRH